MTCFLSKLYLLDFKNYKEISIELQEGINCFVGENGEGKTNILDALHYLSLCKSAFQSTDSLNIRHGQSLFAIQGTFQLDGREEKINVGFKKGTGKQIKRNQKEYDRLADHVGLIAVVMISPYDMTLVTGFGEDRRRFVDSVVAQYDREYLENLMNYNRLLSQRNALLRHMAAEGNRKSDTLDILNMQMEAPALHIHEKRKAFFSAIEPVFQELYGELSGGKEKVKLTYRSHLNGSSASEQFRESFGRDLMLQHTSRGVHRDDLVFLLDKHPVKRIGSQGQQKTYLIALKLAQYRFMRSKGLPPILMIDDVFDKLDENRVAALMKLLTMEEQGQVLITDAHHSRLPDILNALHVGHKIFHVSGGMVTVPERVDVS